MMHWLIAPVILPAMLAPILAFVMRHDIVLARVFGLAGTVSLFVISAWLFVVSMSGETLVYYLGNWPAPFGIVLVLDRLSALMVLLTSVLALIVLLYAIGSGWDNRGRHFHALFQFQLMGVCGAFLTGDAFNLFVFFEILLIASYGLMIHSGGKTRMQAGLQYVVMNLAGSTLFLFALGTLYATTGTLSIADLAVKVAALPADEAALLRVAAILLLIVFAVKAALFPVHFWLPGAYANAPLPVAALFAIMTKVGAYAIIRFYNTVFPPEVGGTGTLGADLIFVGAVVTLGIGAIGVLGAKRLAPLVAFSILASMGTLMIPVSLFTAEATAAALYYMVHSTFAAAVLFLVADMVIARRGAGGDALQTYPAMAQNGMVAALFFGAAISMAGMPPLSGFLGKLLILKAAMPEQTMVMIWIAVLVSSLILIMGFARAGSAVFWKTTPDEEWRDDLPTPNEPSIALGVATVVALIGLGGMMAAGAGPAMGFFEATAAQLEDNAQYIDAVLAPMGRE